MSDLWTPNAGYDHKQSTAEHNADVINMLEFRGPVQDAWNPVLRKIDDQLRLARAKPRAIAAGVIANYYHFVRLNPGAPIWVMPLHDGNYNFVEPSSMMLERLRESDLQDDRVVRHRLKQQMLKDQAEEKQRERDSERRKEIMMDSWKARTQVRIPFHTDQPWTQNVAGKRGKRVN